MKYEVCPLCGSALDFGEKCDCETENEKEKSEPPHSNVNSSPFKSGYVNKPYLHYSTKKACRQDKN